MVFLSCFRSENGYRLSPFCSWIGCGFRGGCFNSKSKSKSLCLHSILSNDDKISAYVNMYVVFVTLVCFSENGCGKRLFWCDIGSRFRESGGAPLPRIPRGTPEGKWVIHLAKNWPMGQPRPQGAFPREPGKSTLATRLAYRLLVATSAYNN